MTERKIVDYAALKIRHRAERGGYPQELSLRVHRALSWLDRAERSTDDPDVQFILLWVAFNSAYAQDVEASPVASERTRLMEFLAHLCRVDKKQYDDLLWSEFSGSIRVLLDNPYVFQPHWDWRNGRVSEEAYLARFATARSVAEKALATQSTYTLLEIVLLRLYTLRNQLVHGGATWRGETNRDQVRDGVSILCRLVPLVISTLMNHPDDDWGPVHYPVVD